MAKGTGARLFSVAEKFRCTFQQHMIPVACQPENNIAADDAVLTEKIRKPLVLSC